MAPHLTAVFYKYWWHEASEKRPWCRLELPIGHRGQKVQAPLCSQTSLIYSAHVLPVCGLQRGLHFTELLPGVRPATSQTPESTAQVRHGVHYSDKDGYREVQVILHELWAKLILTAAVSLFVAISLTDTYTTNQKCAIIKILWF